MPPATARGPHTASVQRVGEVLQRRRSGRPRILDDRPDIGGELVGLARHRGVPAATGLGEVRAIAQLGTLRLLGGRRRPSECDQLFEPLGGEELLDRGAPRIDAEPPLDLALATDPKADSSP